MAIHIVSLHELIYAIYILIFFLGVWILWALQLHHWYVSDKQRYFFSNLKEEYMYLFKSPHIVPGEIKLAANVQDIRYKGWIIMVVYVKIIMFICHLFIC